MTLLKKIDTYIKNEISTKFPVVFQKIQLRELNTPKLQDDEFVGMLKELNLKKYGCLIKFQTTLFKPICNNDTKQ